MRKPGARTHVMIDCLRRVSFPMYIIAIHFAPSPFCLSSQKLTSSSASRLPFLSGAHRAVHHMTFVDVALLPNVTKPAFAVALPAWRHHSLHAVAGHRMASIDVALLHNVTKHGIAATLLPAITVNYTSSPSTARLSATWSSFLVAVVTKPALYVLRMQLPSTARRLHPSDAFWRRRHTVHRTSPDLPLPS